MSADCGSRLNVGVLCIQGAFIEHIQALKALAERKGIQINVIDIRKPSQLVALDGLIIPGGESTTLSVFLSQNGFEESLKSWLFGGSCRGVLWGTCAGLILIANKLTEQKKGGQVTVSPPYQQVSSEHHHLSILFQIGGLDVECSRNTYGRQLSSFESPITLHSALLGPDPSHNTCPGVFIRAPSIVKVTSPEVEVLGTLEPEGTVVAVQQNNLIATSFHPELTSDSRWHEYFIEQVILRRTEQT